MKKSLPILTILSVVMSANSFAQYRGYYDGPAVDVNFGATKPAKYAECDRFRDNTIARYLYSCEFGRDEADRMAERFGGGNGKIQGYLRGYAWGLYKSERAYENDQTEYAKGAAAVDSIGNSMKSGLEAGRAIVACVDYSFCSAVGQAEGCIAVRGSSRGNINVVAGPVSSK